MTITLTWLPSGSTAPKSFVLADSPANIPMGSLRINGTRVIEHVQLFRADEENPLDRGNRRTTVTFETTRLFGSQQDAESFLLLHETQFPGQFLATFTSGAGSRITNRYLVNAVVEAVSSAITGCTTRHSYKITGGAMSTSPS